MSSVITLELRHLKRYPHFDSDLALDEANELVNCPDAVVAHAFYPFIARDKVTRRYRAPGANQGSPREKKTRPLRRAARRDAAIFAAYRIMLAEKYEERLREHDLHECVIAYRSIPVSSDTRGKSNIHHALEAFERLKQNDASVAVVLDIASFFDNIDHERLKAAWKRVLGEPSLPRDHFKVFKAITNYSWVDQTELLYRLGLTRTVTTPKGTFTVPRDDRDLPRQLCTPATFRNLIAEEKAGASKLLTVNRTSAGIPQGSPMSDVLANLYLLEFDVNMKAFADSLHGIYRRYSDDILFIVPGGLDDGRKVRDCVRQEIACHGSKLEIKQRKTHVVAFAREGSRLRACSASENERHPEGLEYLGFRFDGLTAYFRDSTVTRYRRKVKRIVREEARSLVWNNALQDAPQLIERFPIESVATRSGRVPQRELRSQTVGGQRPKLTFRDYASRAERVFKGASIQIRFFDQIPYRRWIADDVRELVPYYVRKREAARSDPRTQR